MNALLLEHGIEKLPEVVEDNALLVEQNVILSSSGKKISKVYSACRRSSMRYALATLKLPIKLAVRKRRARNRAAKDYLWLNSAPTRPWDLPFGRRLRTARLEITNQMQAAGQTPSEP
jgi:hypothetical protein